MKMFVKATAIICLLVTLLLLLVLIPPHRQIGKVNPALPSEESLRDLLTVDNGPTRVSFVSTSTQRIADGLLSHNSVLVEWPNGDMMLIDAGMDKASALEFGELMEFALDAEVPQIQGTIAQILGDEIARVKAVGFTHLHIDHAQGIVNFCEARGRGALLLQTRYQQRLHNFNTTEGAALVADSCLEKKVSDGDGLIGFDGFPGVALYPLGGHTPGSTLFAVADGDRLLLFTGDITNSKADILENRGKGFVYSYLLVPENTARTSALRRWLRDLDQRKEFELVVSHDLENMQRVLRPFN